MTSLVGQKIFGCMCLLLIACFSDRIKSLFQQGAFNQTLLLYVHLLSVGSWIGMQAWVIFIAGITMYFNMPRHVFGHIQSKLWPLFFRIGTGLTVVGLLTHAAVMRLKAEKTTKEELQHMSGLIVSAVCSVLNALILEPKGTSLWMQRFLYEKERGFGEEVGPLKNKEALNTAKYKELTHNFAKVHGLSSIATVFAYGGCLVYMWYLTCHLIST